MAEKGRPQYGHNIRTALKEQRDSASMKPHSTVLTEVPPPEENLSEYAAGMWTYICGLKLEEHDLREQWLPVIHTLAKTYDMESQLEIQAASLVVHDANGKPYANPAVNMLRQIRTDIVRLLTHLNLTPASVARTKTPLDKKILVPPTSVPAGANSHAGVRALAIPGMN